MRRPHLSGQERALEAYSMSNMPMALLLYAVSAMKLRANDIALFFFDFRNECERIGRYRPQAAVEKRQPEAAIDLLPAGSHPQMCFWKSLSLPTGKL